MENPGDFVLVGGVVGASVGHRQFAALADFEIRVEAGAALLRAEVVDVTKGDNNAFRGSVSFEGEGPERKRLPMDAASLKLYDGKAPLSEEILINNSGGLAYLCIQRIHLVVCFPFQKSLPSSTKRQFLALPEK